MQWTHLDFVLTDAPKRVDLDRTFELLSQTYWGVRRPHATVEKMVQHSLCFTLLHGQYQVGFARAVADYTVFSWIADLVIDPQYRDRGLGKWMMTCMRSHPQLRGTQMVLQTRDAHGLYEQFGFSKNPALMSTAVPGL